MFLTETLANPSPFRKILAQTAPSVTPSLIYPHPLKPNAQFQSFPARKFWSAKSLFSLLASQSPQEKNLMAETERLRMGVIDAARLVEVVAVAAVAAVVVADA